MSRRGGQLSAEARRAGERRDIRRRDDRLYVACRRAILKDDPVILRVRVPGFYVYGMVREVFPR